MYPLKNMLTYKNIDLEFYIKIRNDYLKSGVSLRDFKNFIEDVRFFDFPRLGRMYIYGEKTEVLVHGTVVINDDKLYFYEITNARRDRFGVSEMYKIKPL